MAATSQPGQSRRGNSRGRTQAKRTTASTPRSTSKSGTSRSSAASKNGTSKTSKNGSNGSRSGASAAAKRSTSATKSAGSKAASSANGSSNGHKSTNGQHEVLTNLGVSVFSAAVGVVGGALLTRKTVHQRKVLGIPVPEKVDLSGVADQIGSAGKQFGELAGEVRAVRQKAEQIGRLLS